MRVLLRLVLAAAVAAPAGYGLLQLRELSKVRRTLAEAQDPSQALAALSGMPGSGAVQELVAAQAAQLSRLTEAGASGEPASAPPAEPVPEDEAPLPSGSAQRAFTASSPVIRLKPGEAPPPGAALLIDHKTGERLALKKTSRPAGDAALPGLPSLPAPIARAVSDDLAARTKRAYALLLSTAAAAFFLVWRARRALVGG